VAETVRRPILALFVALGGTLTLSGCALFPFLPQLPHAPQQPSSPDGPVVQGPTGWNDLEPCDDSDFWVWVEGYPVDQLEAAGVEAECGGTYFDADVPTYTSVGDNSVTDEQLDQLRAQLEAVGYTETGSTFEHPKPGDDPGLVGSWQYERNADDPNASEAIFIVNFWHGTDPAEYQTFVDYESPETRELEK
jgi:hypothetical protein